MRDIPSAAHVVSTPTLPWLKTAHCWYQASVPLEIYQTAPLTIQMIRATSVDRSHPASHMQESHCCGPRSILVQLGNQHMRINK